MNLEEMTGPALLELFNKLAVLDNTRKVKSFKSREAARRRITTFLLKQDKHVDDIEQLLETIEAKKKVAVKVRKKNSGIDDGMKIVILKTDKPRGKITKAWQRFVKLMSIEDKTVGSFLKVVGKKVGQGDLKYWNSNGRIKIE